MIKAATKQHVATQIVTVAEFEVRRLTDLLKAVGVA